MIRQPSIAGMRLLLAACCLLEWRVQARETVFTNLIQLRQAAQNVSQTNGDVQMTGTIYSLVPEKNLIVLSDASDTDLLELKSLPDSLRIGQRIQIIATNCVVTWQRTRLSIAGVTAPDITVIGAEALPLPAQYYIGQVIGSFGSNVWVSMEGQARFVSTTPDGTELELRSPGGSRLEVVSHVKTDLPAALLLNNRIRATGVGLGVFSRADQKIWGVLAVTDRRNIQVIEVMPELWAAYPVSSLAEIPEDLSGKNPEVVHLAGRLNQPQKASDEPLVLDDGTGKIILDPTREALALAGKSVEAVGIIRHEGTNVFLAGSCVRARATSAEAEALPLLTTGEQVLRLKRKEALRGYPVRLYGVVTSVLPGDCHNFVVQDFSHGIFVHTTNFDSGDCPQPGEFWEIRGVSGGGAFSPIVHGQVVRRLGAGRLPEPLRPAWDQLINGSLDNQFVEIEGIITGIKTNSLTLLTHWGKISVAIVDQSIAKFSGHENKLVRLRGCFKAVWDEATHQLIVGVVRLDNATVNPDQVLPTDPFSVALKTVGELRRFDLSAGAFQRVHLDGQVVAHRNGEFFLMSGRAGLRFIADESVNVSEGDLVEVAGYPELGGPSPVLRETVVKKTGRAALPEPKLLSEENFLSAENDAIRVRAEGTLVNLQSGRGELILEMRDGLRSFTVRLKAVGGQPFVEGSRLRFTGVYVAQSGGRAGEDVVDSFDLLVNSPLDVQVLARPPWWTFKRLLLALGILAGGLTLAGVWILLLRRQVERRTAQLERANRQREQAERARVLDEERLRIARDLHDDLGSSLTEITMLGSMTLAEKENARGETVSQIVKKARDSVNALDVIVWAVNPKENSLQSLADYLASFADEFLTASGIACRLNLPVSFPVVTLDGRTRHDLFLATKEALNNAVRHARATEIELGISLEQGTLVISVRDNGAGFDRASKSFGHGLGNLHSRLAKLGGECQIESVPGGGTSVMLKLVLSAR